MADDAIMAERADAGTEILPAIEDASEEANRSESMGSEPSEEEIRRRAYQRYLERGGQHGADFEDWLEAERELRARTRQV